MTAENGTAAAEIVRVEPESYDGLRMVVSPAEATRRLQELQAFVQKSMVKDIDYGIIPGTGDKPTLYQPGAQKLAEIYGFTHRFEPVETVKDWERGFFYFEYRCVLVSRRNGQMIGEGIGSCNSRESKYAGRWVPLGDVPPGMKADQLQKRSGARWVFQSEIPAGVNPATLEKQQRKSKKPPHKPYDVFKVVDDQYLIPNSDPYSLVNTLQKMAAKRAYIHAVIAATRSSGILTQDVEDLPPEVFGEPEEGRSWEKDEPDETPAAEPPRAKKVTDRVRANAAAKGESKGDAKPEPKPDPKTVARFEFHCAQLANAKTMEQLVAASRDVQADITTKALVGDQIATLVKLRDEAKERIEKPSRAPSQEPADSEPPQGALEGEQAAAFDDLGGT